MNTQQPHMGLDSPFVDPVQAEQHTPPTDADPQRFVKPEVREARLQVVTTGLGVVFVLSGLSKLFGLAFQVTLFERFGFPVGVMMLVGVLELLFALLTLAKPTRPYGAMGLAVLMAGAAMTHIMTGVAMPMIFANVVLFPASVWVVIKQRPDFLRLR